MTLNKKSTIGLIIYVLIIGAYLGIATTTVHNWRKINIDNSPIVFITPTGVKYHRAYHYYGRNSEISLFEAVEKGYSPCRVCNPMIAPDYEEGKPGFYFYNWVLMTVVISLIYWAAFTRLN